MNEGRPEAVNSLVSGRVKGWTEVTEVGHEVVMAVSGMVCGVVTA